MSEDQSQDRCGDQSQDDLSILGNLPAEDLPPFRGLRLLTEDGVKIVQWRRPPKAEWSDDNDDVA
jgi:hypothetical protein